MRYLKIWSKYDWLAFSLWLCAFYEILVTNIPSIPSIKVPQSMSNTCSDLATGYFSGYVLFLLTSFLKWRNEQKLNDIRLYVRLRGSIATFHSHMEAFTKTDWRPRKIHYHRQMKRLRPSQLNHIARERMLLMSSVEKLAGDDTQTLQSFREQILPDIKEIQDNATFIYETYGPYLRDSSLNSLTRIMQTKKDKCLLTQNSFSLTNVKILSERLYEFKVLIDALYY